MFRRTPIANDGSEGGTRTLAAAIALARSHKAALRMATVEERPRFPTTIDEVEEEKVAAAHRLEPVVGSARTCVKAARVKLVSHIVGGHTAPGHSGSRRTGEMRSPGGRIHEALRPLQPARRQHDGQACRTGPLCRSRRQMIESVLELDPDRPNSATAHGDCGMGNDRYMAIRRPCESRADRFTIQAHVPVLLPFGGGYRLFDRTGAPAEARTGSLVLPPAVAPATVTRQAVGSGIAGIRRLSSDIDIECRQPSAGR